jgi:hypothetical protein
MLRFFILFVAAAALALALSGGSIPRRTRRQDELHADVQTTPEAP